jgi:hypothetical protein
MNKTLTIAAVVALAVAGCERADTNGGRCPAHAPDHVYINDAGVLEHLGETAGIICFNDGVSGYPTVLPPITTPDAYPVTGP